MANAWMQNKMDKAVYPTAICQNFKFNLYVGKHNPMAMLQFYSAMILSDSVPITYFKWYWDLDQYTARQTNARQSMDDLELLEFLKELLGEDVNNADKILLFVLQQWDRQCSRVCADCVDGPMDQSVSYACEICPLRFGEKYWKI